VSVDPSAPVLAERPAAHAFLMPGTLYCSAQPAVVTTVLGSCVAVCLLDRRKRVAGMNHFVLPYAPGGDDSLRYGGPSLERLLRQMERFGCSGRDLYAKVFGGAAVLAPGEGALAIGTRNVELAINWLRERSIAVTGRRTGGTAGLLIRLHGPAGDVLVRAIRSSAALALLGRERPGAAPVMYNDATARSAGEIDSNRWLQQFGESAAELFR
jgi:chemotaxis protein CheD